MKKSKWTRLGLGICLLAMLFLFQGTTTHNSPGCWMCEAAASMTGYLEIHNNTPYNIFVSIVSKKTATSQFSIKTNPSFMRIMLDNGHYRVIVLVVEPLSQLPVFYKIIETDVPGDMATRVLKITTPIGYIPVPK